MPKVSLPITEWNPAQGTVGNPGVIGVSEALPLNGSWTISPETSVTAITSPSTYSVNNYYGLHVHPVTSSTTQKWLFAGTNDKLLRGSAADSLTMGTAKGATSFSAPDGDSGWQFCSFGNSIYATNGVDKIQYAAAPGTDFVDSNLIVTPSSYDPLCKYMTTIKNHMLIGNISFAAAPSVAIPTSALTGTSYSSMVMWSATDAPRRFGDPAATPSVLGADYQDILDDYGPITGLSGGDFAYIFKPRAVYIMEGPPWTFRPLAIGVGTVFCNSIVRFFDDVYFWTTSGPVKMSPNSTSPSLIAQDKLSSIITDSNLTLSIPHTVGSQTGLTAALHYSKYSDLWSILTSGSRLVSGWADYKNSLICWSFDSGLTGGTGGASTARGSIILVYSIVDQRWGFFQFVENNNLAGSGGVSVSFTKSFPVYFSQRSVFDNVYFLCANGSSTGIGKFVMSGGNARSDLRLGPTVKTGYFSLPLSEGIETQGVRKVSRITRIRPIYSLQYGEINARLGMEVTVRSIARFPDNNGPHVVTTTYDPSQAYQNPEGWVDIHGPYGVFHQIQLSLVDDASENARYLTDYKEIEIEYALGDNSGSFNTG